MLGSQSTNKKKQYQFLLTLMGIVASCLHKLDGVACPPLKQAKTISKMFFSEILMFFRNINEREHHHLNLQCKHLLLQPLTFNNCKWTTRNEISSYFFLPHSQLKHCELTLDMSYKIQRVNVILFR
jgi:hypothetical protein